MESETILTVQYRTERNYGIDLLRIVSMFMVCLMHILGHGGILGNTTKLSLNYEVAWFIECIAYCAVNCYALISGYVGAKSKYKLSNILYLWLQVVFYSVIITVIFAVIKLDNYSWKTVVTSFFPVIFNQYWYFTAYFGLFLFMPILKIALNCLSEKQLRISLILVLLSSCILTIPNTGNLFNLNSGYSTLWLIILYLVGGYIKKYDPFKNIKGKILSLILIGLFVLIWLSRLCIELATQFIFGTAKWGGAFITYLSPLVFAVAVIMLELFSRIKFKKKPRIVVFMASVSFGVYLIHEHPIVRSNFITGTFTSFATYNPVLLVLAVIGSALAIYLICSLLDYLRLLLFKLLKVQQNLTKLETKLKHKFFKEEKCLKTTEN